MARVMNIEINGCPAKVEDVHRVATWGSGNSSGTHCGKSAPRRSG
jgi:hypothetical protein